MKKNKPKSEGLEASVEKILDLRASRVRALASKVSRLRKRLAILDSHEIYVQADDFKKC
jgi:hypothetical protein